MWPAQAKSTSLLCQKTTRKNLLAISNHETNVSSVPMAELWDLPHQPWPWVRRGGPKVGEKPSVRLNIILGEEVKKEKKKLHVNSTGISRFVKVHVIHVPSVNSGTRRSTVGTPPQDTPCTNIPFFYPYPCTQVGQNVWTDEGRVPDVWSSSWVTVISLFPFLPFRLINQYIYK